MQQLKEKLLNLGIVENNEYLDNYCQLIIDNKDSLKQLHKTQSHHIIPRYYYKQNNLQVNNDKHNLVNLFYKDHILAHYYLALCSNSEKFIYANVSAIYKMSNCTQTLIEDNVIEFFTSLDKYQQLYETHARYQGSHLKGKSQTPEHVAKRVHKNTGQKRSLETRQKMSAWQKGVPKSEQARKNMSEAQKRYMQTESEEHRRARIAKANETKYNKSDEEKRKISEKISKAMKGKVVSEETKLKRSVALKGVKKDDSHKLNLAQSKSKYRYTVDNIIFESTKEVIDYLKTKFEYELPYWAWRRIINEQSNQYGIKVKREEKINSIK